MRGRHSAKVTKEVIELVKTRLAGDDERGAASELSRELGLSRSTISNIKAGLYDYILNGEPSGRGWAKKGTKNVTIDEELLDELADVKSSLSETVGCKLTISQTISILIRRFRETVPKNPNTPVD